MTVLYLNRSLIFETRLAAHQVRSIIAFETAEGGMDWITGALNTPYGIDRNCLPQPGESSFRTKVLTAQWNSSANGFADISAMPREAPGCRLNGNGQWSCLCPASNANPDPGTSGNVDAASESSGFTASITSTLDPEAVQVVITACSSSAGRCTPNEATKADANASISALLKMRPLIRKIPTAALVCGQSCVLGASDRLSNQDLSTGGLNVESGGSIQAAPESNYQTLPGTPPATAARAQSPGLQLASIDDPACRHSRVFARYFGTTEETFSKTPTTLTLSGCHENGVCDSRFDQAYADGWRSYYFPDGYSRLNTSGMGTMHDPVLMVSGASFSVSQSSTIFGLVFVNSRDTDGVGPGQVAVNGALIHCGNYRSSGPTSVNYLPEVMARLRRSTSLLARVPGSWTDRCINGPNQPPQVACQ